MITKLEGIGILGGTFNPVHRGHMAMAESALNDYGLEQVWFIPNYIPPHKEAARIDELSGDRLAMLELALGKRKEYAINTIELARGGRSYTWETMKTLHEQYPDKAFWFIIGTDSLLHFHQWVEPERILSYCGLLVAVRTDKEQELTAERTEYLRRIWNAQVYPLSMDPIEVSSTQIRTLSAEGKDISSFVPDEVAAYIKEKHLYEDRKSNKREDISC